MKLKNVISENTQSTKVANVLIEFNNLNDTIAISVGNQKVGMDVDVWPDVQQAIRNLMKSNVTEATLPTIPRVFTKLFKDFPVDATSWKNATDEIRDVASTLYNIYGEFDNKTDLKPIPKEKIPTAAMWNSMHKAYIVTLWNRMSKTAKQNAINVLSDKFPKYF